MNTEQVLTKVNRKYIRDKIVPDDLVWYEIQDSIYARITSQLWDDVVEWDWRFPEDISEVLQTILNQIRNERSSNER